MTNSRILCWLFLVISFSCKFKVQEDVVPEWEADVLGPLVTAKLTAQDLADIDPLHAQKTLSLADIGVTFTGVSVVIPAKGPLALGPYNLDFTDAFGTAEFESGELYFTVSNEWEVGVKSGTRIIVKDGTTELLKDTLDNDLSPLGGFYISPSVDLANKTLSSSLNLELENFRSIGSGTSVLIDPNRRLVIDIYIKNVKFRKITVTSTNLFSLSDTSQFSLEGGVIKSESVNGTINTYVTSSFPVELELQVYFMDESNTIKLDSLFDEPAVIGEMNATVPAESKFVTSINDAKTQNLNNSRFVRSYVKMSTGNNVVIYDTTSISVKMVGDFKIQVAE